MGVPPDKYQGPTEAMRKLAVVADESLAMEIRSAMVAIGWWCDAWTPEVRALGHRADLQRVEVIRAARDQVAALGASATVEQLEAIVHPLLNGYFPPGPGGHLGASIELMRGVVTWKLRRVRQSQQAVAEWEDPAPYGLAG